MLSLHYIWKIEKIRSFVKRNILWIANKIMTKERKEAKTTTIRRTPLSWLSPDAGDFTQID